jgi:hypothetical protein
MIIPNTAKNRAALKLSGCRRNVSESLSPITALCITELS